MKEEYDFSEVEQGKFYRPIDELEVPVVPALMLRFLIMVTRNVYLLAGDKDHLQN